MPLTGSYQTIISAAGVTISGGENAFSASQGIEPVDTSLPPGKAGTLTTRTDANTGVATLSTGHGIQTADKVDVYWADGCRRGMDATVDTNDVTIDGGAGDDLPDQDTALVVTKQVELDVSFDGDNLVLIGAVSGQRGILAFLDDGGALVGDAIKLTANIPWGWATGYGINPLSGNAVAKATVSNASSTATAGFKMTGLQYAV